MCVYIYIYIYKYFYFDSQKKQDEAFGAPCVGVSTLCVCVTCVLVVHVPNENKCSALLLVGSGDVEQWQPPLCLSELGGYFGQEQY